MTEQRGASPPILVVNDDPETRLLAAAGFTRLLGEYRRMIG